MSEPQKEFLRWSDLVDWLTGLGISVRQIRKLIKTDKIKKHKLIDQKRAYYMKHQIKKDILGNE